MAEASSSESKLRSMGDAQEKLEERQSYAR
jgi:hypothetical protein